MPARPEAAARAVAHRHMHTHTPCSSGHPSPALTLTLTSPASAYVGSRTASVQACREQGGVPGQPLAVLPPAGISPVQGDSAAAYKSPPFTLSHSGKSLSRHLPDLSTPTDRQTGTTHGSRVCSLRLHSTTPISCTCTTCQEPTLQGTQTRKPAAAAAERQVSCGL